jgi:S-ribosylhomocysteine lyase
MQKIASFQVDHTELEKGLYISRIDDDITTYDIRMIKPNTPPFLEIAAVHTIEHLFATFARNEYPKNIIYFGPMGCRTGFYLLTKNLDNIDVIKLVQNAMNFIANFEGKIPGVSETECGNYLDHDLKKAKKYAVDMCEILKNWDEHKLDYAHKAI